MASLSTEGEGEGEGGEEEARGKGEERGEDEGELVWEGERLFKLKFDVLEERAEEEGE